jgi:hypothetical protein
MGRGRGGPGLLGAAARTAVVAGTATAVSGRVATAQQARQSAAPPPQPGPAVHTGGSLDVDQLHAQLTKLAELRSAGLLTDAEFDAQKTRMLAM